MCEQQQNANIEIHSVCNEKKNTLQRKISEFSFAKVTKIAKSKILHAAKKSYRNQPNTHTKQQQQQQHEHTFLSLAVRANFFFGK